MRKILAVAVIIFLFQVAVKADAASLKVEQVAGNVYVIKGYDFNNVGGVEVEVSYDTAILSNPRISQGSELAAAMFMPNPKFSPSSAKIAAMSLAAIKSGDLATITFDLKGDKAGSSSSVSIKKSKLAEVTGTTVKQDTPTVTTLPPFNTSPPPPSSDISPQTDTASTGVSGSPSVGTITLPADQFASTDRKTDYQPLVTDLRKDMTVPLAGSEAGQASAGKQKDGQGKDGQGKDGQGKEQEKKFVSYKSALQLFSEFKGEKSPKSLIPLFAEGSMPEFTQEPPIAFSDGKTPLRLSLVLKATGSEAPKFILQGANVKKLSGEGEELVTWTVDAIPKKDAVEAKLTVIDGQNIYEIPLTIVPRIDPLLTKGKALSEADFSLYLRKPSRFDLNKDKKFDAVDDFIYTANYIVAMKIKPEKVKKEEKKEPSKPGKKDDPKAKEPSKVKDDPKAKEPSKVKDDPKAKEPSKVKDDPKAKEPSKVKDEPKAKKSSKVKAEKDKTADKPAVKP